MATVQDYLGTPVPKLFGPKLKKSIGVGIEVELEKVLLKARPTPWTIVADGSLKINGKEFTIPTYNTYAETALTKLFSVIKAESSERCSVHVHVNIADYTIEDLHNIIILYLIFENTLYRYSGRRWNSNYCVPVRSHLISKILDMDFKTISLKFPKYSGLHFFADTKYNTVEFRQMAGTMNKDYINNWIMVVSNLVKYAQTITTEQLIEKISDMYTTSSYWDLAKEVFGEYYNVLTNNKFKSDVESGILFVKVAL